MTSVKPIIPRPSARFLRFEFIASGIGVLVMSHRLSSWRIADRELAANRSQSHVLSSFRCADKLMETRLQTAVFSASCGNVISVHRLLRWIVDVLLFNARTLMVSFQVS